MPQAIIFDLDDTLVSYDAVTEQVWDSVCRRFAPKADGLKPETLYNAIGRAKEQYWSDPESHRRGRLNLLEARRELVKLAFSFLNIDSPELAVKIADTYTVEREDAVDLFPGAIDTLTHLRKKGLRMALITNGAGEMQRSKLKRFGLEPFFDSILIEGEFGAGKPESRLFIHTLEKLEVDAPDVWMVGDDLERDIAPCRTLGIYAVWVDWKRTGLPSSGKTEPDKIINNIGELIRLTSE